MPGQMLTYRWFAKTYGWNPRMVDELTVEELFWFPAVEDSWSDTVETLQRLNSK
jgi:hypothetical protein